MFKLTRLRFDLFNHDGIRTIAGDARLVQPAHLEVDPGDGQGFRKYVMETGLRALSLYPPSEKTRYMVISSNKDGVGDSYSCLVDADELRRDIVARVQKEVGSVKRDKG